MTNLHDLLNRRPQPGTVKITHASGTATYHQPRSEGGRFSGPAPRYEGADFYRVVGKRVAYRRNARAWWSAAVRRAERKESVSQPTRGVTRTRYWRRGVVGAQTTVQFDSRGEDIIWSLQVDVPAVSVEVRVPRWYFRPGHVEVKVPDLHLSVEGINRRLDINPLSVWNYPWGKRREWGVSVLRVNGASLLLWATPEEGQAGNRLDVLWRHLRPRMGKGAR